MLYSLELFYSYSSVNTFDYNRKKSYWYVHDFTDPDGHQSTNYVVQCDRKLHLTRKWILVFQKHSPHKPFIPMCAIVCCEYIFVRCIIPSSNHKLNLSKVGKKMETWIGILHSIIIEWLIEIDQLLSAYFSLFIECVFQKVITYRQYISYINTENKSYNVQKLWLKLRMPHLFDISNWRVMKY